MEITVRFEGFDFPRTNRDGKGKSYIDFPTNYCMIDTETTGHSPQWDDIIEIGAIRYKEGSEIERFQTLVKPFECCSGMYVDEYITELTGITNEMLSDAPPVCDAIRSFADFLKNDVIIGYNVSYDVNFLYDCYMEHLKVPLSNNFIDVLRMARKLYPEMAHHRLCDMVDKFGFVNEHAHRSISDVEATEKCYEKIHQEAIRQYGTEKEFIKAFRKKYSGKSGCEIRAKDIISDNTKHDPESPLYNKRCVFTGKLEKFTRKQAMQIVANLGGINEDTVTKKTNYLILGNNDYCVTIRDGKSTKQKKAEKNKLDGQDIEIVPETVFYDMLGDFFKE